MSNDYLSAFVDELYQNGVRDVVMSPGSRSTALALLFEEYGYFKTYVNIDERSSAFFALGAAKASGKAVVLICTSGSAGAHFYPAVVEAFHSRLPLIILTADRPYNLQEVSAPQTMNQAQLFGEFVSHFETLNVPRADDFWTYPRKVAQRAILKGQDRPVQINVPVSEPLVPDLAKENFAKGRQKFHFQPGTMTADFDFRQLPEKTLILAGRGSSPAILKFAEKLKIPVLADPLSNLRRFDSPILIDAYDAFLTKKDDELLPEMIVQFGQMPVSKRLQQFVAGLDADYLQVDPSNDYRNTSQTTTEIIQSSVEHFVGQLDFERDPSSFLDNWQRVQIKMREQLNRVANEPQAFEGRYVQVLQQVLPSDSQVEISNSMEIRDVDYFWQAGLSNAELYCNRGLNGIDGQVSTALGISTTGKTTVLLTGDLSFLHDMNGLVTGKTEALNLTIVLFNNDGGGIFQHLAQKDAPHFERLFSTPHGLDFSALATLTGLDYHAVAGYEDFAEHFSLVVKKSGIHLLEIKTDKALSLALHEKYVAYD